MLEHYDSLDALTGSNLLVLAIADRSVGGQRASKAKEVYAIARDLGASVDALPCAVFFTNPGQRRATRIVRISAFLPEDPGPADMKLMFRAFVAAADTCVKGEQRELSCLRGGLIAGHYRAFPSLREPGRPKADAVRRAAATGKTILETVAAAAVIFA